MFGEAMRWFVHDSDPILRKSDAIPFTMIAESVEKLGVVHQRIIDSVQKLMVKFRDPIPAAKLIVLTDMKPKINVDTRWSSVIEMLRMIAEIRP